MPWLRPLAVLFAFLAAFVRPAPASAFTPTSSVTRVGGFEVAAQLLAGELGAASHEQHQGIGAAYDENASGYRFAAGGTARLTGEFSVIGWKGYPSGVARPSGPFRLLEGAEYDAARAAANRANAALRAADPAKYAGKQIHEIHPVKFGGSPTDPANKIALTPAEHAQYTTFWNRLMRDLQ